MWQRRESNPDLWIDHRGGPQTSIQELHEEIATPDLKAAALTKNTELSCVFASTVKDVWPFASCYEYFHTLIVADTHFRWSLPFITMPPCPSNSARSGVHNSRSFIWHSTVWLECCRFERKGLQLDHGLIEAWHGLLALTATAHASQPCEGRFTPTPTPPPPLSLLLVSVATHWILRHAPPPG
jgi:hypothetical protein